MKWLAVLAVVSLAGCKDRGEEPFKAASAQYEALVVKGTKPADPAWDAMLAELKKVPSGSAFRPKADAMENAVAVLRSRNRPGLPLALGTKQHDGEVAEVLAECEVLAKQYGVAPDSERPGLLKGLDACRHRAEVLDAEHAHQAEGQPEK